MLFCSRSPVFPHRSEVCQTADVDHQVQAHLSKHAVLSGASFQEPATSRALLNKEDVYISEVI